MYWRRINADEYDDYKISWVGECFPPKKKENKKTK